MAKRIVHAETDGLAIGGACRVYLVKRLTQFIVLDDATLKKARHQQCQGQAEE